MDVQQNNQLQMQSKVPFFWKKHLWGILISPLIGVFVGSLYYAATMPKASDMLTDVGEDWGNNLLLLRQKSHELQMQNAWKIPFFAWLAMAVGVICAIFFVQRAINQRRREVQASSPEAVAEFERQVARQEPLQWVMSVWHWLHSLTTPDGQQQTMRILTDFFSFRIILVEYFAPILYLIALGDTIRRGIELATRFIVNETEGGMVGGVFGGLVLVFFFFIQALLLHLLMEKWFVYFSIHGVIRSIRERLCGEKN